MTNSQLNSRLSDSLAELGFPLLPDDIVDSHGMPMKVGGDVWNFNIPTGDVAFDFSSREISNPWLDYSLRMHTISCLQRVSPRESYNVIAINTLFLSKVKSWDALRRADSLEDHASALANSMGEALEYLRREGVLYNFARLRAWYLWCVDNLEDFGFTSDDAYRWEMVRVPGNEKGVAVRRDDAEAGPINDAELILLRKALTADQPQEWEHVKERAAVWIALAFGRNAANYAMLRLRDFLAIADEGAAEPVYQLLIPRIKKRAKPRSKFKEEYVDPRLAAIVQELIDANRRFSGGFTSESPLFLRASPREKFIGTDMDEWAWHLTSSEFTALIRSAVQRYGLISPRTGELLHLTTRRLRYTYATNRVREGVSARDLADALDHSDLQHVRVYFDARSTVVERLDVAAAKQIAPLLALFQGNIVDRPLDAVNGSDLAKRIRIMPEILDPTDGIEHLGVCGKREICKLYPPYSCYACDRFQPFRDSLPVHARVLDHLVERRARLLSDPRESDRIAVQLDEVIYACAEVVARLQPDQGNHAASD